MDRAPAKFLFRDPVNPVLAGFKSAKSGVALFITAYNSVEEISFVEYDS